MIAPQTTHKDDSLNACRNYRGAETIGADRLLRVKIFISLPHHMDKEIGDVDAFKGDHHFSLIKDVGVNSRHPVFGAGRYVDGFGPP